MEGGFLGPMISGIENSMDRQGGTAFSHYWALRNERFQEHQTGSAYQRAVRDMQLAGLNPMLAYSQGGASSAQGAKAQYTSGSRDPGAGITSAMVAREQVKNMREQNRLLEQDVRRGRAEADKAEVEKVLYRGLLPMAEVLRDKIGTWSAASAKAQPDLSPGSIMDAARGKTTDLFEWIGETLQGLSSKESWIRRRDEMEKGK